MACARAQEGKGRARERKGGAVWDPWRQRGEHGRGGGVVGAAWPGSLLPPTLSAHVQKEREEKEMTRGPGWQ